MACSSAAPVTTNTTSPPSEGSAKDAMRPVFEALARFDTDEAQGSDALRAANVAFEARLTDADALIITDAYARGVAFTNGEVASPSSSAPDGFSELLKRFNDLPYFSALSTVATNGTVGARGTQSEHIGTVTSPLLTPDFTPACSPPSPFSCTMQSLLHVAVAAGAEVSLKKLLGDVLCPPLVEKCALSKAAQKCLFEHHCSIDDMKGVAQDVATNAVLAPFKGLKFAFKALAFAKLTLALYEYDRANIESCRAFQLSSCTKSDAGVPDAAKPDADAGPAAECGSGRYTVLVAPDPQCLFPKGYDGSGRVRDNTTGLTWMAKPDLPSREPLATALAYCSRLGMRLPTKDEALGITPPTLCAFPCPWQTWTSTAEGTGAQWVVWDTGASQVAPTPISKTTVLCVK